MGWDKRTMEDALYKIGSGMNERYDTSNQGDERKLLERSSRQDDSYTPSVSLRISLRGIWYILDEF
jgi:hypothetical protein